MTINVRGIKSKLDSLESYLKANEIHIAGITETHLQGKENIYIDGYRWIGKNRNKDGGGVGFCIKDTLIPAVSNEITNDEKEILWITFKAKETIKIGVYYGKQENYNREKMIKEYEEITEEANDIKPKEHIIIMGDFNAKLKVQRDDCNQLQSRNGTLLKNMMKQTNRDLWRDPSGVAALLDDWREKPAANPIRQQKRTPPNNQGGVGRQQQQQANQHNGNKYTPPT